MNMTQVMQRLSLHYSGNFGVLRYFITQVAGLLETLDGDKKMRAFGAIDINFENKVVILEVSIYDLESAAREFSLGNFYSG